MARKLNLCILFIDMERSAGSLPYRVLACADAPHRAIVLKRQGPIGHFVPLARTDGRACFSKDDLPDVLAKLFDAPQLRKLGGGLGNSRASPESQLGQHGQGPNQRAHSQGSQGSSQGSPQGSSQGSSQGKVLSQPTFL